jgi:threonyl-tRNA synthetase
MRSLLLHCKKFDANITGLATRGIDVAPEELSAKTFNQNKCITAFITVEDTDNINNVALKITKEIEKFCTETNESDIVLAPFAHLSNKLAPFKIGIEFFDILEKALKEKEIYNVSRVHFGSDKELLLHLFGHPGNVRYREF